MRVLFRRGLLATAAVLFSGSLLSAPAYGVAGGTAAPANGFGFVADVKVGKAARGCSGALVDPEWVVTAKSCFAEGAAPVPAGPPVYPTTVTVGREDLTTTAEGQVRSVSLVVPHVQRDLLLAKLDTPVVEVAPVKFATTAPAAGEALQVAGFGRTAGDWVPDRLHVGSFAVQSVAVATVNVVGSQAQPASICKGDAGGPAVRAVAGGYELVALNGTSWQAGCLGTAAAETRNGATETRLDNVRDWVRRTVRGGNFVRLPSSAQVLDTRSDLGLPKGQRPAGSIGSFQVTGVGGIPSSGVTAVLIDVTAVTTGPTFLTLFPDGTPLNHALSMLNADAGQILSNTAVVPVPASGKLSLFNHSSPADVLVDVQGYFTTDVIGGGFTPVDYTRLVDTRTGLGGGGTGVVPAWGGSRTFKLTGTVIPNGTRTAFVDLIVTDATGQGWIGVYPPGGANDRSAMDYVAGTTAHAVSVPLDADGRVTITNNGASSVHVVVTATGYFTTSATAGSGLRTLAGTRRLDTREAGTGSPVTANGTVDVALGVPAGTTALVNLTVFENTAIGSLRAWPVGGTEPDASLTNYPAPNTTARSGLAAVRVGTDGKIRIRNASGGATHIIVDLQGWYAPPPAGAATATVDAVDKRAAASAADTPQGTVEDYLYPNADRILAEMNVRLISGDGHIVLADCADQPSAGVGLIEVYTTENVASGHVVCFRVRSATGILNLELPGVFEIRGDGQTEGTGHEVTAELIGDDGQEVTVELDPDGSTQVGVGVDENNSPTTLLRLTAGG
ncbi:S1 family peptidase [Phytohabitans sp. LJ34]|uniref:S1 family peptidase n=1 Tax=Phytohabitans sp. LJ34 TaxID=3452217 RepID=UPI003F8899A6